MRPEGGAILALDVGDVRIGVAVAETTVLAVPLPSVSRRGRTACLDALERLVEQHGVGRVLVGLPLLEDGREGEQAAKTRAFARSLARRLPKLAIEFVDERHSTGAAKDLLGARARPGTTDSVAAALLLQDRLNQPTPPPEAPPAP